MSGVGCSSSCRWEYCGNGTVDVGGNPVEECDDGNNVSGDSCSSTCQEEPVCGDGTREGSEQCDDGNMTSGDGCSASCRREQYCGDGRRDPGEQCDDGNMTSGDGCSANCTDEVR
jgi:cysteine-rich repeat protein